MTQVPLQISRTVKCVLGNPVMKFREFPLLPNVPSFHPKAGWHPGIREGGSHSGHTHTTRRQIIQDTILTA